MQMQQGDGIRRPLDEIRNEDELRQALLHIDGIAMEYAQDRIDESLRNHCYFRGDYMSLMRSVPAGIRNKLSDVAQLRTLQKDIIHHKVQQYTALLARAAPKAQAKALLPESLAEYEYAENMFTAGEYDNRLVADKFNDFRNLEWDLRKKAVLQKRIVQESLITGEAFEVFSLRNDPWRGPVVQSRLVHRGQVVVDPACKNLATFEDARYIRVQTEMSAAEIFYRFGLREADYKGGDQDTNYIDDYSTIRRFWHHVQDKEPEMKREMPTYPVKAFFWNPGVPDLISFDGNMEDMQQNPQRRDRRPRLYILVNDYAIAYGFEEHHRGPDLYGYYPIVAHCHDPLTDRAAGSSLVSTQIGTQDFVNILYNAIAKNVQLNAHTQWMAERGAVRGKNFSMKPNVLITVERDALARNRIQQIEPGDIGTAIHNLMQSEIAYSRELAGDPQGILSGIAPATVKSGIHAQTLLETANTLMAEYARMLDVGHQHSAWVEAVLMQRHSDFTNPFYVERLGLQDYPNIDIAMADLKFEMSIDTKANLPSTTVSGELNWYQIMYNQGLLGPAIFMKLAEMSDRVPEEWMRKMERIEEMLIPGIPIAEQIAGLMESQKLQNQLAEQLGIAGAIGQGEMDLEGFGSMATETGVAA